MNMMQTQQASSNMPAANPTMQVAYPNFRVAQPAPSLPTTQAPASGAGIMQG